MKKKWKPRRGKQENELERPERKGNRTRPAGKSITDRSKGNPKKKKERTEPTERERKKKRKSRELKTTSGKGEGKSTIDLRISPLFLGEWGLRGEETGGKARTDAQKTKNERNKKSKSDPRYPSPSQPLWGIPPV